MNKFGLFYDAEYDGYIVEEEQIKDLGKFKREVPHRYIPEYDRYLIEEEDLPKLEGQLK